MSTGLLTRAREDLIQQLIGRRAEPREDLEPEEGTVEHPQIGQRRPALIKRPFGLAPLNPPGPEGPMAGPEPAGKPGQGHAGGHGPGAAVARGRHEGASSSEAPEPLGQPPARSHQELAVQAQGAARPGCHEGPQGA